jgi:hypothetical protein
VHRFRLRSVPWDSGNEQGISQIPDTLTPDDEGDTDSKSTVNVFPTAIVLPPLSGVSRVDRLSDGLLLPIVLPIVVYSMVQDIIRDRVPWLRRHPLPRRRARPTR